MRPLSIMLLLLLPLAGCSLFGGIDSGAAGAPCEAAADCDPGQTCLDGTCVADGGEAPDANADDVAADEGPTDTSGDVGASDAEGADDLGGPDAVDDAPICPPEGCEPSDDCSAAQDGDRCDLDAVDDGYCFGGACVSCFDNTHCEPSPDLCKESVCTASGCVLRTMSCDDGQLCTEDTCVQGDCVYAPLDGQACDGGRFCRRGQCTGCASDAHCQPGQHCNTTSGDCVQCVNSDHCGSGGACTTVQCLSGRCHIQFVQDGTPCAGAQLDHDTCHDGMCGECASSDDCSDGERCFTGNSATAALCGECADNDDCPIRDCNTTYCREGSCKYNPAFRQQPCDEGDGVCDDDGVCMCGDEPCD